jgi:hypothetical protein
MNGIINTNLTLQNLTASKAIKGGFALQQQAKPYVVEKTNIILMNRWEDLKTRESTQRYAAIMWDIEAEILKKEHLNPLDPTREEVLTKKVSDLFLKLDERCDVSSYFGNAIPFNIQAYIDLSKQQKDEALFILWDAISSQVGILAPLLLTPKEIKDWLRDPANAPQLMGITNLDLKRKGIKVLPPEIGFLTQLRTLDLSINQISSIPSEIGSCTRLRELNLYSNEILSIPATIGSCTQLQELHIFTNRISLIPDAIRSCTQLKKVDFSSNQISSIPDAIRSCTQLEKVDFSSNQISSISPETRKFCYKIPDFRMVRNSDPSVSIY